MITGLPPRGKSRTGFTLIELAVVISIVAVSTGLLFQRALFYQEQAEKAAMEQTVGVVRSALHLQVASLIAKNKTDELPKLVERNPMEWLAEKPKNYAGEYYAPTPGDVTTGNWYFDLHGRNLIYLVKSKNHFMSGEKGRDVIRFQVRTVNSTEAQAHGPTHAIEGVILEQVVSYTWF
jgi:prepilin-type N-terminal cleavage/methylation domain-containing protein